MLQTIRSLGYDGEIHTIETQDGYILKLFRIHTNLAGVKGKQPVFLQHGILSSSQDWVDAGSRSIAFCLSESGYDVWMGNARGNFHSRKHITFSEKDDKYWNFSFHEMGLYDIPACLKYIEKNTGIQNGLIYVGHSMGTTMFFVFASLLPNMARRFSAMVALAPVAFMTNVKSPIKYLAPFSGEVQAMTKVLGLNEFFPKNKLYKYLCYDSDMMNINKKICESIMFSISGFDKSQFDENMLPLLLSNKPAGTSTKTVIHYAQMIRDKGKFQFYDYGAHENKRMYNQNEPPLYEVKHIKVPTLLMYGLNDWLATPPDVMKLASRMTNNPEMYQVPYKEFTHIDFLWARDVYNLVYSPMLKFITKFSIK